MKHLKVGDQAPEFTSKDENGNAVSLSDFKGKKVVIYFYPKDNTPGCTAQACNIRDNYKEVQDAGIVILGVSADDESKHQKFIEKFDLPFTLLADTEKELLNLYGVWGEKKFMGKIYDGIHRTTFILNEDHTIRAIIEKPKTKDHTAEIMAAYE
jgi:peroxiredoxin Q/BCP